MDSIVVAECQAYPAETKELLYDTAAALSNALKYAKVTTVNVTVDLAEMAVTMKVSDNSQGQEWITAMSGSDLHLSKSSLSSDFIREVISRINNVCTTAGAILQWIH